MSIDDVFGGITAAEVDELVKKLDEAWDDQFGGHGQRRRFIKACRRLSTNDMAIIHAMMTRANKNADYRASAQEIEDPARAADAILMLEDDLVESKDRTFLLFLVALLNRDGVVAKLNRARKLDWEFPLLENKQSPPEALEFVWDLYRDGRYGEKLDDWYWKYRGLARHPNCPTTVLAELAKIEDKPVRLSVAKHRNIDETLTTLFLNSKLLPERLNIAKSRHVSAEALLSLMRDKHDKVAQAARKQFEKRFPNEKITDEAIDKAITARIEEPYVAPENPKPTFDKYAYGKYREQQKGLEEILVLKPAQRAAVVGQVDEGILAELAKDKSAVVRRAVAEHGATPDDVLENYLNDSDENVANKALASLGARRPHLAMEDVLSTELVDSFYAALNTCLNEWGERQPDFEKLDAATRTKIDRAKLVAQYSNNPVMQMRICRDLTKIPDGLTLRWALLSTLANNLRLGETAVRKVALELGFASERILLNCKQSELVRDHLSNEAIPRGERMRLEAHLKTLTAA